MASIHHTDRGDFVNQIVAFAEISSKNCDRITAVTESRTKVDEAGNFCTGGILLQPEDEELPTERDSGEFSSFVTHSTSEQNFSTSGTQLNARTPAGSRDRMASTRLSPIQQRPSVCS